MQQFVVPQFIDVEDKIIGPVTVRQFLILLVAGLLVFIAYRLADFTLFIILLALIGGLALTVAFVKINGQTFHYFLLNIIQTMKKPSQRLWNKKYTDKELNFLRSYAMTPEAVEVVERKEVERRHIRDLSLIVNTGGYYRGEEE
ncbi:MAG: hypothetical protein A3C90_01775 [Candidatus Magasanikbacteria bacterium RIFCSPHIGHO2_02_FULL_51_14]|uniref:PrgI family protein n=1 Tax=Candidatus Magasanikbacteria bacterium RIFCSPHIGHO2_02_FULL_51_14 TaxID=1798683 RepID=A0A1F6MG79_9BACT|nr:MAG: hypothetical protein A3C90_01775 [Candidatus Magasanikbacteria bacterium RIFCSPHIGHO2_02_FULL_51_14]